MVSNQRKLTALLHELQHARSPLAQARVVARSWRTLRELSPTDRRLLARHLGFEGAEEIIDGLSRKGGLAPAMLLRVLGKARATDESTVAELLSALRDPDRRDQAISMGADLASDLLAEPAIEHDRDAIQGEGEVVHAVEEGLVDETGSLLADHGGEEHAVADVGDAEPIVPSPGMEVEPKDDAGRGAYQGAVPEHERVPEPEVEPEPMTGSSQPPSPTGDQEVDWSGWQNTAASSIQASRTLRAEGLSRSFPGRSRHGVRTVTEAIENQPFPRSKLGALRQMLSRFEGSNVATLSELVHLFPDGWVRRRAICLLFEGDIVLTVDDALEVVSALGRESDRRWCLGVLALQGALTGSYLDRALELVSSPWSRNRLRRAARS